MQLYRRLFNTIIPYAIPRFCHQYIVSKCPHHTIFPFYHTVSDYPPIHIKHLYHVKNIESFINDLDYLARHFIPISLDQFYNNYTGDLSKKRKTKPNIVLSFDDGLSEIYHIIAPILLQKGIPAVFFINSAFVDNKALMYRYKISIIVDKIKKNHGLDNTLRHLFHTNQRCSIIQKLLSFSYNDTEIIQHIGVTLDIDFENYLKLVQPYMTINQITSLQKQGFDIGNHSFDHPKFSEISEIEQQQQIIDGQKILEKLDKIKFNSFAFPFHDLGVSDDIMAFVSQHNQLSFGTSGIKNSSHAYHFHRICMEEKNKTAQKIIQSEIVYRHLYKAYN